MANIAFKRGLAANLPANGSAVDGVFYLTTDSHRLYVGQDTSLVELNRYILEVANTGALPSSPAEGDFVWVKEGNMLLVCTDPKNATALNRWTQINPPDTDDDTQVTGISDMNVASNADGITVSFKIAQTTTDIKGKTSAAPSIPVSFTIAASDLATANEVAVDLDVAAKNDGANIKTGGPGADAAGGQVNLLPGSNVTIGVSGSDVTFSAKDTTYTLAAASDKITLTNNLTNGANTLSLADDNIVNLTASGNTITAAHAAFNPAKSNSTA